MSDYSPTQGMVEEARRGLDWRREFGRGGTEVGIARARDIVNGRNLSEDTVKRMFSFFSRHEVDKEAQGFRPGEEGYPSNGRIAHGLWGGDAGFAWSRKIVERLKKEESDRASDSLFLSHLRAMLASQPDAAIRSFLFDSVVAFDLVASRAGSQFSGDKVLVSTPSNILSGCDRLKVLGIDARTIATKVINVMSFWDGADKQLIRKTMCWDEDFSAPLSAEHEVAVSRASFGGDPIPAAAVALALFNLTPESFFDATHEELRSLENLPTDNAGRIFMQEAIIKFRAAPDALSVGDFVSWDSSGGRARGRVERILREGTLDVPDTDFTLNATEEDPAALIRLFRNGEATDTMVGHRFSTLTKIAEIRSYDDYRAYPNEHAARLADLDKFDGFRRDNDAGGDGIDFVYGIMDGGADYLQSVRFACDAYTPTQARAWLSERDFNVIELEEATKGQDVEQETKPVVSVETEDRLDNSEINHRAYNMEAKIIDEDKRTALIAVSSELAVERSFGKEVLMHEEGAIDLAFLASGRAPLLLDHDMERQIGVIESVSLTEDRKLRAKVRFGRSALAQEVFQDVVDGIRSNISVGYRVNKMERDDKHRDVYRVKSWSPLEVSVVSIPADPSVGVGRSAAAPEPKPLVEPSIRKDKIMSEELNLDAVRAEAAKEAARNASEIIALGARHNKRDLADAALRSGQSIEQFRGELLNVLGEDKPLTNLDIGLSRKERKEFRLVRAIASLANPSDRRLREAAAFEFEASEAAAQRYGRSAQGIMIPTDVLGAWKRDLNTGDDNELVATDLLAGEFVDALRNASSVMQAGARMLNGLSGNVSIPTKATAASGGWIATEGGASAESEPTFGAISLTPKTVGGFTDMTRQMIIQSSLDIEALVRDDLTQALALAIDKGALEGTAANGQPRGILNTVGVNTVADFAAAVPTFAEMVSLETAVAVDNALMGNLAYITGAATAGGLKTRSKDSGSGMFVLEGGEANGYPVIVSNQATAGNVYFGNFSDLLIGMFGGLDITVDPFSNSSTGTVRIVALQSVDVGVRHAVSFAFGNDGA